RRERRWPVPEAQAARSPVPGRQSGNESAVRLLPLSLAGRAGRPTQLHRPRRPAPAVSDRGQDADESAPPDMPSACPTGPCRSGHASRQDLYSAAAAATPPKPAISSFTPGPIVELSVAFL